MARRLWQTCARVVGHGLLQLGAAKVGQVVPPIVAYWRGLGSRHGTALCTRPDVQGRSAAVPPPSEEDLAVLASAGPMMPGAEYLTVEVLGARWKAIGEASPPSRPSPVPRSRNSSRARNVVGRVHFHVADNRVTHDHCPVLVVR